ncbi:FAD-dependent oxidoreductase [cf. Phormidesmis sp. LEGE 11477]|nr:FAD-dependent oxidoreductase [cf. Phormidesmis sp. LEGE 11477]
MLQDAAAQNAAVQSRTASRKTTAERTTVDAVVVGSGLGGLVAGALLARYGRRVVVCESHTLPGGAAHAFTRQYQGQSFTFDSGPSFYCGLGEAGSANPLTQVLAVLGESLETIPYEPFGYYHLPEGTLPVYGNAQKYQQAIDQFSPGAGAQMAALEARLLKIYGPLKEVPTLALRADLWTVPLLAKRYGRAIARLLPTLPDLDRSMGEVMAPYVSDPWLKRLLDLECFLLSGMKCEDTVAPEMAFMFGERASSVIDYPIGGSGAIVEALVRGLKRWGGQLRLGAHVQKIITKKGKAKGVVLKNGEQINAPIVISNATRWDTYRHLLDPAGLDPTELDSTGLDSTGLDSTGLAASDRQAALSTPAVDSFMHLHLGIRADGLASVPIHHVVVHNNQKDITTPGNTCMVSIPTVLDPQQAPAGYHTVHAYTLEPFDGWQKDEHYEQKKREKAETLFQAIEKIIPDVRDRIELELIGTPLTHSRFLRRYKGTYGPAISAKSGRFPNGKTPIKGLHLVGDSTLPGIGVPAVAASGILCANSLVTPKESTALLDQLN